MRKGTLMIIPLLVVFTIAYFGPKLISNAGFVNFPRWFLSLVGLFVAGIVVVVLAVVNPRILAWRKARGRDIEEEERYETEHGMIRLTPVDESDRDN